MDVYCVMCGEPVDPDEFHNIADDRGTSYTEVARRFASEGCPGIGVKCNPNVNRRRVVQAEAFYELLGDDMDGAAAMFDEFDV